MTDDTTIFMKNIDQILKIIKTIDFFSKATSITP